MREDHTVPSDQQWKAGQPGTAGDGAFYLRRTDSQGAPVVLELHLGLHDAHTVAAVHIYDAPADHTTPTLDGCVVRCTVPAREVYEAWLVEGRNDQVVWQALAELDVPPAEPPLAPGTAALIAELRGQVARLQQTITAAGLTVTADAPPRRKPRPPRR